MHGVLAREIQLLDWYYKDESGENMARYEDLTEYSYQGRKENNTYNIGWLEGSNYPKGSVTKEFLMNLWEYMKYPIYFERGIYKNEYLDDKRDSFVACYNGYEIVLGCAEIRVLSADMQKVYAAPNLIIHYILNHGYLPPLEFVEAVINGAKPNSKEYSELIADIYSDIKNDANSKLICPYCHSNKNYFAPSEKKEYEENLEVKVVRASELVRENLNNNDYFYHVICKKCGKMFPVSFEDIIGKNKMI